MFSIVVVILLVFMIVVVILLVFILSSTPQVNNQAKASKQAVATRESELDK